MSDLTSSLSTSSTEATRSVATFHQLQRLLQQSLRDLHAESSDLESAQEQELSQSLQRLTGRLHHILAELTDLDRADSGSVSVLGDVSVPRGPIHLMTSREGVVLMANDAAVEALKMDVAKIGMVELAEWIPYEEWRLIRQQLKAVDPPQGSVSWVVSMALSGSTDLQRMMCTVVPMLDQSRNVTAWHWELRMHQESPRSHHFATLIQGLEAELLNGQSLDCCMRRICEGLVNMFEYPFVWMATVRNGQRIQLRAHASMSALDWDVHGPSWWSSISRQDELLQACAEAEGSLVSRDTPHTGEFSWFPTAFLLQEAYCIPLGRGELSGLLVVCSRMPNVFDLSAQRSLEILGDQIQNVLVRGMEIEQFRFHSVVLSAVLDPVCVTDTRGRIEWMNPAFFRTLGSTHHQVGTPLRSFPHAQFQEAWPTFEATSKAVGSVKTEIMEKGSNGESLVFEQSVTPLVDAQGFATHFAVSLHDVTVRAVAEMQMKHQAYHDSLTDLPNRIMFEDHLRLGLAQARRDGTLLALLFLDLDNFKPINDQYGHQIGDRLLRVVAKRLVACVRTTDTVSRLSGDEFTIVLQGLERIQDIRQVARKVLSCLAPPISLDGQDIPVQISIGIAVSPNDSTDPRNLLAMADQAMYRAKDFGGQRWSFATVEWNSE